MILYHGTSCDNARSIIRHGFVLGSSDDSRCVRQVEHPCIYGFTDIKDAQDFALNQGYDDHAVVAFDVKDPERDPEYDHDMGAWYCTEIPDIDRSAIVWTHRLGRESYA